MKEYLLFLAAGAAIGGICENTQIPSEKEIKTNCCKCYYDTVMPLTENKIFKNKKNEFTLLPGPWEKTN